DGGTPPKGFYGSAQYVMWDKEITFFGTSKLGPYNNVPSPHLSHQSRFHRSPDLCGTCHDVSNPLTGDLAPNNGAQVPLPPGRFSGVLGSPVEMKAAFKNFPYQYGAVERTYSEHKASLLPATAVSAYGSLPSELRDGAIKVAHDAAV